MVNPYEKSEQIPESIKDARAYSLQKKYGVWIITFGNPKSESKYVPRKRFLGKRKENEK